VCKYQAHILRLCEERHVKESVQEQVASLSIWPRGARFEEVA
jgi:hypothetical protein